MAKLITLSPVCRLMMIHRGSGGSLILLDFFSSTSNIRSGIYRKSRDPRSICPVRDVFNELYSAIDGRVTGHTGHVSRSV